MNQNQAREIGRANGTSAGEDCEVSSEDKRNASCPCPTDDPVEFCEECLGQAAHDAEQNARQYADHLPEIDTGENEGREEALWDAYEDGVTRGINQAVRARVRALARRRAEAANDIKALLHPSKAPGDWGALTISPLEGVQALVTDAANDDVTNETWQRLFVSFGHSVGLAQEAAEVLTGTASEWDKVVGAINRMGVTQTVKALAKVFGEEALREAMRSELGADFLDSAPTEVVRRTSLAIRDLARVSETPVLIEQAVTSMQERRTSEALDSNVTNMVVVGGGPEDKWMVFGRNMAPGADPTAQPYVRFAESEQLARYTFQNVPLAYNVRTLMAPRPEGSDSRTMLTVFVARGGYDITLNLASADAQEFDYIYTGPDPDSPVVAQGILSLEDYGFGGRLGNWAVWATLDSLSKAGTYVPEDFLAQAAMAAGVQPDPRVRELIAQAAEEDPGEDMEGEVLRRARTADIIQGQERCPDCPHPVGDHDNIEGCTHEGCDCYTKRGYDI